MNCEKCDASIDEENAFCTSCGTKISKNQKSQVVESHPQESVELYYDESKSKKSSSKSNKKVNLKPAKETHSEGFFQRIKENILLEFRKKPAKAEEAPKTRGREVKKVAMIPLHPGFPPKGKIRRIRRTAIKGRE